MKTKLLTAAVAVAAAISLAACGGGGSTAAVDTSSKAYQLGVKSGTDGNAETEYFTTHDSQEACHYGFAYDWDTITGHSTPPDYTTHEWQDYLAGCSNALNARATVVPPSKKGPGGATVPNK
jgi:hypothetical protein